MQIHTDPTPLLQSTSQSATLFTAPRTAPPQHTAATDCAPIHGTINEGWFASFQMNQAFDPGSVDHIEKLSVSGSGC
jgi:hypothetical protein